MTDLVENSLGPGATDSPLMPGDGMQDMEREGVGPTVSLCVDEIEANEFQPRMLFEEPETVELAETMRTHGLLNPIVVRPSRTGMGWRLIAGERRLRAAKYLGWKTIPAKIREYSDQKSAELALIENDQRVPLNPIERARGYRNLLALDPALTQSALAARVGLKQATMANLLRLLGLPEDVQDLIARGVLEQSHGRALLKWQHWPAVVSAIATNTVACGFKVKDLETKKAIDLIPAGFDLPADVTAEPLQLGIEIPEALLPASLEARSPSSPKREGASGGEGQCETQSAAGEISDGAGFLVVSINYLNTAGVSVGLDYDIVIDREDIEGSVRNLADANHPGWYGLVVSQSGTGLVVGRISPSDTVMAYENEWAVRDPDRDDDDVRDDLADRVRIIRDGLDPHDREPLRRWMMDRCGTVEVDDLTSEQLQAVLDAWEPPADSDTATADGKLFHQWLSAKGLELPADEGERARLYEQFQQIHSSLDGEELTPEQVETFVNAWQSDTAEPRPYIYDDGPKEVTHRWMLAAEKNSAEGLFDPNAPAWVEIKPVAYRGRLICIVRLDATGAYGYEMVAKPIGEPVAPASTAIDSFSNCTVSVSGKHYSLVGSLFSFVVGTGVEDDGTPISADETAAAAGVTPPAVSAPPASPPTASSVSARPAGAAPAATSPPAAAPKPAAAVPQHPVLAAALAAGLDTPEKLKTATEKSLPPGYTSPLINVEHMNAAKAAGIWPLKAGVEWVAELEATVKQAGLHPAAVEGLGWMAGWNKEGDVFGGESYTAILSELYPGRDETTGMMIGSMIVVKFVRDLRAGGWNPPDKVLPEPLLPTSQVRSPSSPEREGQSGGEAQIETPSEPETPSEMEGERASDHGDGLEPGWLDGSVVSDESERPLAPNNGGTGQDEGEEPMSEEQEQADGATA